MLCSMNFIFDKYFICVGITRETILIKIINNNMFFFFFFFFLITQVFPPGGVGGPCEYPTGHVLRGNLSGDGFELRSLRDPGTPYYHPTTNTRFNISFFSTITGTNDI